MKKILVVDDDLELCRLLKQCMENEEYHIETVHNGKEAASMPEKGGYDLVILDIMLPGMNGLDILRRLREKSNAPVIVLSAVRVDNFSCHHHFSFAAFLLSEKLSYKRNGGNYSGHNGKSEQPVAVFGQKRHDRQTDF